MGSISLIVPRPSTGTVSRELLEGYKQALVEKGGFESVDIIITGDSTIDGDAPGTERPGLSGKPGHDRTGAIRAGISAANGDYLVILDSRRAYPPEALLQTVEPLKSTEWDFSIAVSPKTAGAGKIEQVVGKLFGSICRIAFGTSDPFSGLVAMKRSAVLPLVRSARSRGSRIVLDLLSGPRTRHIDVPVLVGSAGRQGFRGLGFDDLRQCKRVLDRRFGTLSRLIQFCMVGASGMVVDLCLYAILQLIFSSFWPAQTTQSVEQASRFSWQLATAGGLSILCALVWNFSLNRRLTFNDSRGGSIIRQFLTYALGNALGIAVSLFLRLYLPGHYLFFARHKLAAAVVGIVVATGISFSMSRWVVFKKRTGSGEFPPTPRLELEPVSR